MRRFYNKIILARGAREQDAREIQKLEGGAWGPE